MSSNNIRKFYIFLVHIILVILIIKSDYIFQLKSKLGIKNIDPELTYIYKNTLTFHQRVDKNIPKKSIYFIGDSMVQGLAVTAIIDNAINFGIGQDTTLGVINRIPLYTSLKYAKLIVIAIGVNDLVSRNNQQIINNYKHIIRIIPKNVPVLFSSVLPVKRKDLSINSRIGRLNKRLKIICSKADRTYFLDISSLIEDSQGNLDNKYHIGDGLHLNKLGNQLWIDQIKNKISKIDFSKIIN